MKNTPHSNLTGGALLRATRRGGGSQAWLGAHGREFDIVVAGAGIAGAVAVEGLNSRYPGRSIGVIEAGCEVGGRLRSVSLGEGLERAELGGEYVSSTHQRTLKRAKRLGLDLAHVNYIRDRHFIRGRRVTAIELARRADEMFALREDERGLSPTALFARALASVAPGARAIAAMRSEADANALLKYLRAVRCGGIALSEQTFQRAASAALSEEGFAYVQASAGASEGLALGNCANAIDTWLWEANAAQRFFRIGQGAQELVWRTLGRCDSAVNVLRLHKLTHIDWDGSRFGLRLSTPAGVTTMFARELVLALTAQGLRDIVFGDGLVTAQWRRDLAAIGAAPATKLALAFEPEWWMNRGGAPARGEVRAYLSDQPLPLCHARADANTGAALVTGLASGHASAFWSNGCATPALEPLRAEATRRVQRFWDDDGAAQQLGFAFADWTQTCGGGWHLWRCGADSQAVAQRLRQPNRQRRLFICGEVLAQRTGWIESAIENAEDMLERCFGAPASFPARA